MIEKLKYRKKKTFDMIQKQLVPVSICQSYDMKQFFAICG